MRNLIVVLLFVGLGGAIFYFSTGQEQMEIDHTDAVLSSPEQEWKPEIEDARQHDTKLTLDAKELGDETLLKKSSEDLESDAMFARMGLSDLQGLPLPNQ